MFLMSAALLLAMQTTPEYAVVVVKDGPKGCEYRAEGRRLTQAQLEHRARVWAGQRRRGEVQSNRNISFQCVGQAIQIMQDAGMEKVAYVGKPIGRSVLLGIRAQGCVPLIDGDPLTMEQLRVEAKRWGRDKIELHFTPDADTDYECVDSVVKVVQANSGIKFGFIGNEQAPAR